VQEIRTVRTLTAALVALADGLQEAGGTPVAMDSTGGSWPPVSKRLEGPGALLVVHAQPSKTVPGRNTDGKEAAWMAALLRPGVRRGRCIPSKPPRQ
jgi:hypothetical protein